MNRTQEKAITIQDSSISEIDEPQTPSPYWVMKIKQDYHVEEEAWYQWFEITRSYGDQERSVER